jgi:hypothetical protein
MVCQVRVLIRALSVPVIDRFYLYLLKDKIIHYENIIAHINCWQLTQTFLACSTRDTLVTLEIAR